MPSCSSSKRPSIASPGVDLRAFALRPVGRRGKDEPSVGSVAIAGQRAWIETPVLALPVRLHRRSG